MEIEFIVTICMGRYSSGDVCAAVEVTDEEYEAIRQCCREEDELQSFPGLEYLCERIIQEVKENGDNWASDEDDEDIPDPDDVEYAIQLPDEIYDEVCQEMEDEYDAEYDDEDDEEDGDDE